MKNQTIQRDPHTISIEDASYRWGYIVITFGLFLVILIRCFLFRESNWDLFALVVLGGLTTMVYQTIHKIFPRRWLYFFLFMAVINAAIILFITVVQK